jgi:rhodanese-related sulfurtransferase
MGPFDLIDSFGQVGFFGIVFLIGIGFGSVLEMSGFGNSTKLAAQFYFKDLTVLKVMFTAIIVAMTLIFFSSSMGLLDYDNVWVNTTYLFPGIVGGLIMGVGFVIGGFCPGTSLVAMASLKIDGLLFVVGGLFGIFIFGETIDSTFAEFWNSSYMGRFTLPELFDLEPGVVVFIIIIAALVLFAGADKLEEITSGKKSVLSQNKRFKLLTASALSVGALVIMLMGQPDVDQKWEQLDSSIKAKLENRDVFIHPIEMLHVIKGRNTKPILLDLRPEIRFNRFHIVDSENTTLQHVISGSKIKELKEYKNSVVFLISDSESETQKAWKSLTANKVANVYMLEGGINNWQNYFSHHESHERSSTPLKSDFQGNLRKAMGDQHLASNPDFHHYKDVSFQPKVKLQTTKAKSGGCG